MHIHSVGNSSTLSRFSGSQPKADDKFTKAQDSKPSEAKGNKPSNSDGDDEFDEQQAFDALMASLSEMDLSELKDSLEIKQSLAMPTLSKPEIRPADQEKLAKQKSGRDELQRYLHKRERGHKDSPLRNSFTPDEF